MTCPLPQRIADQDLLAYLDGEAGVEVEQHVAGCPDCRARAATLGRQESRLVTALYRIACPTPHELGEYHLQLLPGDRARAIQEHVAGCHSCAQEVTELQRYLADLKPDVERGVLEETGARVKVWVARLAGGMAGAAQPLQLAPAVVGVRGDDEGPRIYEADDIQVSIEVQPDPDQPTLRRLLGLVLSADPEKFRAHLWQHGTHITSVAVDEFGNLMISGLEPDSYELILDGPEVEVHVQDVAVV